MRVVEKTVFCVSSEEAKIVNSSVVTTAVRTQLHPLSVLHSSQNTPEEDVIPMNGFLLFNFAKMFKSKWHELQILTSKSVFLFLIDRILKKSKVFAM